MGPRIPSAPHMHQPIATRAEFWTLLLGRIVTGLGVGVAFVVTPVYMCVPSRASAYTCASARLFARMCVHCASVPRYSLLIACAQSHEFGQSSPFRTNTRGGSGKPYRLFNHYDSHTTPTSTRRYFKPDTPWTNTDCVIPTSPPSLSPRSPPLPV